MAGEWGAMGPWLLTRTARTAPHEVRHTLPTCYAPPTCYCPLGARMRCATPHPPTAAP